MNETKEPCKVCGKNKEITHYAFPFADFGGCCESCYWDVVKPFDDMFSKVFTLFIHITRIPFQENKDEVEKIIRVFQEMVVPRLSDGFIDLDTTERILQNFVSCLEVIHKLRDEERKGEKI